MINTENSTIIIVPAYNEAGMIRQTVQNLLERNYSVVVVDDASTDNTREVIAGLQIVYIRHLINLGQGAAIRTGIEYALTKPFKYLVTFDADGQHSVEDIPEMIAALITNNAEIAFGSRFLPGATANFTAARKRMLKFARFVNYLTSGILLSDANNGLRVMTYRAAHQIQITENRSSHNAQVQKIIKSKGLNYTECPVNISYSDYSKKKGLRNINSIRVLYDLILFKIFQ